MPHTADTIRSKRTSTDDGSIVIGISLIGIYFRDLRRPLNGLNRRVCDADGGFACAELGIIVVASAEFSH